MTCELSRGMVTSWRIDSSHPGGRPRGQRAQGNRKTIYSSSAMLSPDCLGTWSADHLLRLRARVAVGAGTTFGITFSPGAAGQWRGLKSIPRAAM